MADLSVRIGDLVLKNPVAAASGTFAYGVEYEHFMDISKIGGLFTKGLSPKPIPGNLPPRLQETTAGLLNSIGLQNIGVEGFCAKKLPSLRELGATVFANVFGKTVEEYVEVVERLEREQGIAGYELNLSCPNVKEGGIGFGTRPEMVESVTGAVRKATRRLLIVKLSPNVTDIKIIAEAAAKGGADALSAINTLLGMAIDLADRKPILGNRYGGLSGPAIKPVALRMVNEVSRIGLPVIGIGGISNEIDALEFLVAGATAVQVGSENFRDPCATLRIIDGMNAWLDREGIPSAREMVGTLKA
jgi:dihydroorotate dehydrogenase (NAD+) catalytic subunit